MRCIDLIAAFELEINKLDDSLNKPVTDDSLYWINQAIVKFVKDRFSGNPPKNLGYEQTEKRSTDLIKLFRSETFDQPLLVDVSQRNYNSYWYRYPDDIMFLLNEDVTITDNNDDYKLNTCIFECTADSFMYRINNSLTDFHYKYHRARPLRVKDERNLFRLLTDKNYKIDSYSVGYIKIPTEVKNTNPYEEYTDFEDYTWLEITKIAAQMYIENQADPRYKTISNEVLTQE